MSHASTYGICMTLWNPITPQSSSVSQQENSTDLIYHPWQSTETKLGQQYLNVQKKAASARNHWQEQSRAHFEHSLTNGKLILSHVNTFINLFTIMY